MNEVTLTFYLEEEVTPDLFARKVAVACAQHGAIRIGERVLGETHLYEYVDDVELSVLGDSAQRLVDVRQVHP